ncbi:MAG TPA: uroporphyrinogen-III synthase [bacterium]|nr:uroporphyrinogen-III synthase [bacterium]
MTAPGALDGRWIVVTRARAQAGALAARLEAEGARIAEFPTIRVGPLDDYGEADRAIDRLGDYRWIVFTSQNGVTAFLDRLQARAGTVRGLDHHDLAAIGPATAGALRARGLRVDLAPAEFVAEALVEAFATASSAGPSRLRGARVLLPRALEARGVLPEGLRGLGAIVDVVPVYRTVTERDQAPAVRRRLLDGEVDAVTFTSSSTVRGFVEVLGPEAPRVGGRALIACIGPVTAATARERGLPVGLVAREYTVPGLVAALRERLGRAVPTADR